MADAALAVVADLEARVGSLDAGQTARAAALLADASAEVRDAAGQHITEVVDDTVTVRPIGRRLRLPERPVTAVSSVTAVDTGTVLVGGTDWEWDGLDRVTLAQSVSLAASYRVVYSHGYATVPDVVVAVVCAAANRALTASAMLDGVTSETIGQYTVQTASGSSGVAARLTDREKRMLRRRFGRSSGVVLTGSD